MRSDLALAAGPERWTAMEGGAPVIVGGECIGGIGVSGGDLATDERIAREAVEAIGAGNRHSGSMTRAAARRLHRHGLVVGRARRRHRALRQAQDRRLLHAFGGQARQHFAAKYQCRPAATYDEVLADPTIEAIVNTTPNDVHLETTRAAADGRQARVPRQADRQHGLRRPRHQRGLPQGRRRARARLSAPAREPLPLGEAADRRRRVRQAGQRRGQHQPRPAGPDRPVVLALPGRRHAGRRDAPDRHPLHRRAGISAWGRSWR